jgi:hypothetical protein
MMELIGVATLVVIGLAVLPIALAVVARLFPYLLAGSLFLSGFLVAKDAPWLALTLLALGGLVSFWISWRQDREDKIDLWERAHTHECQNGHEWDHRSARGCPLPGSGVWEGRSPWWPGTEGPVRPDHCPRCLAGKPPEQREAW